jgi:hypothetical protein
MKGALLWWELTAKRGVGDQMGLVLRVHPSWNRQELGGCAEVEHVCALWPVAGIGEITTITGAGPVCQENS